MKTLSIEKFCDLDNFILKFVSMCRKVSEGVGNSENVGKCWKVSESVGKCRKVSERVGKCRKGPESVGRPPGYLLLFAFKIVWNTISKLI